MDTFDAPVADVLSSHLPSNVLTTHAHGAKADRGGGGGRPRGGGGGGGPSLPLHSLVSFSPRPREGPMGGGGGGGGDAPACLPIWPCCLTCTDMRRSRPISLELVALQRRGLHLVVRAPRLQLLLLLLLLLDHGPLLPSSLAGAGDGAARVCVGIMYMSVVRERVPVCCSVRGRRGPSNDLGCI